MNLPVGPDFLSEVDRAESRLGYDSIEYTIDQGTGKIKDNLGELRDRVDLVWLGTKYKRVLFPAQYSEKRKNVPLCMSTNGDAPDGGDAPQMGPCCSCPKSQFKNGDRSECSEIYTALFFDINSERPFSFTFKRTAIAALKSLRTQIKYSGNIDSAIPVRFLCIVKMTTKKVQAKTTNYYTPSMRVFESSEPADAIKYFKLSYQFFGKSREETDPDQDIHYPVPRGLPNLEEKDWYKSVIPGSLFPDGAKSRGLTWIDLATGTGKIMTAMGMTYTYQQWLEKMLEVAHASPALEKVIKEAMKLEKPSNGKPSKAESLFTETESMTATSSHRDPSF